MVCFAIAESAFRSRHQRRLMPTRAVLHVPVRIGLGGSGSPLPVIQTGASGGIRSIFFSISALTQITARSSRGMFTRSRKH
jgi:hypothetical protein